MNRAGLDMIQADSLDQVKGQCVYPLVVEEHREAFQTLIKDVFQGKSGAQEFKVIGLKGRPCWLYSKVVPLRNDHGEIVSALSVTVDITERKQTEEERLKLISELQKALTEIKTLHGILPICSVCKKIRNDAGSWTQMEWYIREHSEAEFSHGFCPECGQKARDQAVEEIKKIKARNSGTQ